MGRKASKHSRHSMPWPPSLIVLAAQKMKSRF
jgi:hypothetical protein